MEVFFNVPATKCGLVIGKGGETIRQINQESNAHCELDRRVPPNPMEKTFLIRGMPEQIEVAKKMICEKAGMVSFDTLYGRTTTKSYICTFSIYFILSSRLNLLPNKHH